MKNVYVPSPGAKGVLFRSVKTTDDAVALPASAKDDIKSSDFTDLGGVSDSGFTNSIDRSVKKVKDFGAATVAAPQDDYTETMKLELIESLRESVLETVFGTKITPLPDGGFGFSHRKQPLEKYSWVIDTVQGRKLRRQVIGIGQVTEIGEVKQVSDDIVKYPVTIECFEDADGDFVKEYVGLPKPATNTKQADTKQIDKAA
ncbi:hypothetical protein [Nocardia terpenica]|uniref:phage tail tube protein n=1 Tax=Nocardia terpenica TaxID=455432 RepID=UPI0002D8AA6C|nr:hypothetical protein [Nocardia terpenica]NQE88574.1 hypothetical protein [Nocardia terpenica]